MYKKLIALLIICTLLVSIPPAVAADDTVPRPTVEEILNDYHRKAFEAEAAGEASAAAYSPRSGQSGKTPEQETVETLTAAGYEAYNVTGDNYETLEAELNTDFSEMGLDPDSSYVVVISGEGPEQPASAGSQSTYNLNPNPEQEQAPDGGDTATFFQHTYNGKTYYMRYVTVTAADHSVLGQTSSIELLDRYDTRDILEDTSIPISIASSLGIFPVATTLHSILSHITSLSVETQAESLEYRGATNWTVKYVQVYDFKNECWRISASSEYATMRYLIIHTYYDEISNQYEFETTSGTYGTEYSTYFNSVAIKDLAAIATESSGQCLDRIDYVTYSFENTIVIQHTRNDELLSD